MNINRGYVAKIKHKCLNTILALLELSESDKLIINRIRRTIPITVLSSNLTNLYEIY